MCVLTHIHIIELLTFFKNFFYPLKDEEDFFSPALQGCLLCTHTHTHTHTHTP